MRSSSDDDTKNGTYADEAYAHRNVAYGTDGKAYVLEIGPRKDYIQTLDVVADASLSMDTVTSILDEVAPPSARGKETMPLFSAIVSGSCNSGMTFGEYENTRIDLSYGFCAKPISVHSATVFIKRSECDRWGKSLFPTVHK